MKSTIAILSASMASSALAQPMVARSQQCNVAPSAATNANIKPISAPSATTADACLEACLSNPSCKSFLFGLPANADVPVCELFSVPAAQVPNQGSELYIFDKACSDSSVPNTEPTHDDPRGEINSKLAARSLICNVAPSGPADTSIKPIATPSVKTADECQDACDAEDGCQSFLFGLPADASAPLCKLFKVAPAKVPVRDDELFVFAKGCPAAQVPTTAPTHDEPRGEEPSEQETNGKTESSKTGSNTDNSKTGSQNADSNNSDAATKADTQANTNTNANADNTKQQN